MPPSLSRSVGLKFVVPVCLLLAADIARGQFGDAELEERVRRENLARDPLHALPDVPARVEFLRAAWMDWVAHANCYCHFTIKVSPAPPGVHPYVHVNMPPEPAAQTLGSGVLAKRGELLRIDFQPANAIESTRLESGEAELRNAPTSAVTNGSIEIAHTVDPRDPPDRTLEELITVRNRTPGRAGRWSLEADTAVLSPFTLGTPEMSSAVDLPPPVVGEPGDVETNLRVGGVVHRAILLERTDSDGRRVVREARFRIDRPIPQLVGMVFESWQGEKLDGGMRVEMFDFVDCAGQLMPKRIRQCLYREENVSSLAFDWSSEDLGSRDAAPEDFQYAVPRDVRILGLQRLPPAIDGVRRVDIAAIDPSNVYDPPYRVSDIQDPTPPDRGADGRPIPRSSWRLVVAAMALLVVGGVIAGWYATSRRNSKRTMSDR